MMLQEEMEQLQDLELLIQDMQNSPEKHAAALLMKLRIGIPISQLMEPHNRNLYDRQSKSELVRVQGVCR